MKSRLIATSAYGAERFEAGIVATGAVRRRASEIASTLAPVHLGRAIVAILSGRVPLNSAGSAPRWPPNRSPRGQLSLEAPGVLRNLCQIGRSATLLHRGNAGIGIAFDRSDAACIDRGSWGNEARKQRGAHDQCGTLSSRSMADCLSRARQDRGTPLSMSPANCCTNPMTFAESSNPMVRSSTEQSSMRIMTMDASPDCGG